MVDQKAVCWAEHWVGQKAVHSAASWAACWADLKVGQRVAHSVARTAAC